MLSNRIKTNIILFLFSENLDQLVERATRPLELSLFPDDSHNILIFFKKNFF